MPNCTVSGCETRHYAGGLCRSHYMKRMRAKKTEEIKALKASNPKPAPTQPTKTPSGYVTTLPFSNKPIDARTIGIGEKGAPPSTTPVQPGIAPKPYQFNIGTEYIEMGYEFLNTAAPNAKYKLKLTDVQRANLDAAFAAVGMGTQNPWIVIVLTIIPPVGMFIVLNYDELKLGLGKMFTDLKGMVKTKEKVKEGILNVTGHPNGKPAAATG